MKSQIPLLLMETLRKPGRSTCFLVKIVEVDGTATGFASLDAQVRMNDGVHNLVYDPSQELRPQNIMNTADMEVDNTELAGWFKAAVEEKIVAGAFNSATITIYRVAYNQLAYGFEIIATGIIGQIEYSANKSGRRKIEYNSYTQLLKSKVNDPYSLTCRAAFGDDNCGMPLEWQNATIAEVDDERMRFRVTGVTAVDGFFDLGVFMFDSGQNAGFDMEVETWTADGWVTLSFVTPFTITPGSARIRRDCLKIEQACLDYGNIINMRAEHLTPVEDQALMVPGAYIKSQNAL